MVTFVEGLFHPVQDFIAILAEVGVNVVYLVVGLLGIFRALNPELQTQNPKPCHP